MFGKFRFVLAAGAAATVLMNPLSGAAQTPAGKTQFQFDIPAQSLAESLRAVATATNTNVLFDTAELQGRVAPSLKGRISVDDALSYLLNGSGLKHRYLDDKTVVLGSAKAPATGASRSGTPHQQSSQVTDASVDAALINLAQLEDGAEDQASKQKSSSKKGSGEGVEEMVVEGTRDKPIPFSTANLDLTRSADDALPFTTFTAKDIQLSGAASLQDFFQNRLAQNLNPDIPSELDGSGLSDSSRNSRVDMRGWGATETVFLLNGRRMSSQFKGSNSSSSNNTPDLQAIPMGSIERIEVLTSAGSAIYGASATGGVINIITRQDFKGGQLALSYETPSDVHAPSRRVDFSYGQPMPWGMNFRFSGGYNESEPLSVADRTANTIERWRQRVLQIDPARMLNRTINPPYGSTPNVRSVTTTTDAQLFGNGTANFATVREGYTGGGGLAGFLPGAYNLGLAEGSAGSSLYAKGSTLGVVSKNPTVSFGVDKSFSPAWRWSLDYRYSQGDSEGQVNDSISFTDSRAVGRSPRVPAAAPNNPFGQDVLVSLVDPRLDRPELDSGYTNKTWEINSTLRGSIGEWRGFFDFSYNKNQNHRIYMYFYEPIGGWTNAFLSGAYNPFVDMRVAAPAAESFYQNYIAYRSYNDESASKQRQSSLKISGPLMQLPAGPLQFTAGAEWVRTNRYKGHAYTQYQNGVTGEPLIPVGSTTTVGFDNRGDLDRLFVYSTSGAFAEANVPLISAERGIPLVNKLELYGSGRIGRDVLQSSRRLSGVAAIPGVTTWVPFNHVSRPSVYAFGARYEMTEGLAFRTTTSIGFKPPNAFQVSPSDPSLPTSTQTINDPRRPNNGAPSPVVLNGTQWITGGNPDVIPETTNSTNIGVIFSPKWFSGMRLSVDYIENVRDDAITSISAQDMVNLEQEFPGRIVRGAPDGHASGVGPITFIDYRYINLRQISSKSVDFSIQQQIGDVFGGHLFLTGVATKNISFKTQTTNTLPPVERVRNLTTTSFGQQIRWNGNAQLRWEGQQWSFGWSARYFDYILVALSDQLLQGSDRAPWKLNHDAFISYNSPVQSHPRGMQWLLSGASVTFGVKNVFDRVPRFWAASSDNGVAPYDSIMGRSVWLQARRDF